MNIPVLIIEDDFWIAGIHEEQVEKNQYYSVQKIAKSSKEALHYLDHCTRLPQLILLDIYIPDTEGLTLFNKLRTDYHQIDVIVISAANDRETMIKTKRYGAFDYMVKPADEDRIKQSLHLYFEHTKLINDHEQFNQQHIDHLFHSGQLDSFKQDKNENLPKGIDPLTLQEIIRFLKSASYEPMTATDISKSLGMSRSTARRYMEYLVSINKAETILNYGNIGRPLRQYVYREQNEQNSS